MEEPARAEFHRPCRGGRDCLSSPVVLARGLASPPANFRSASGALPQPLSCSLSNSPLSRCYQPTRRRATTWKGRWCQESLPALPLDAAEFLPNASGDALRFRLVHFWRRHRPAFSSPAGWNRLRSAPCPRARLNLVPELIGEKDQKLFFLAGRKGFHGGFDLGERAHGGRMHAPPSSPDSPR